MASPTPLSHFAPLLLLLFPCLALSFNPASLLSNYPELSDFSRLLSDTNVAADLTGRSSLTLLAVPNSHLRSSPLFSSPATSSSALADSLRYHVLLKYLSLPDLRQIPPSGELVATLFQTTGRAHSDSGALNLTASPDGSVVAFRSLSLSSNATVLSLVKSLPYNLSIFTVDSLLVPYGTGLAASEDAPPAAPPLNITRILADGKNFNVVAAMLLASGAVEEFEADEHGAGITIFAPTDDAFADLPAEARDLQSLPADKKLVVLKFHVLHSYYPLGSLESIVNPVQPTLATEEGGAGTYTLNITRMNRSVAINSGIVQAAITQTVFDENPLAVFGVSKILLPKELFGSAGAGGGSASTAEPSPEMGLAPEGVIGAQAPGSDGLPEFSGKGRAWNLWVAATLFCIQQLLVFV